MLEGIRSFRHFPMEMPSLTMTCHCQTFAPGRRTRPECRPNIDPSKRRPRPEPKPRTPICVWRSHKGTDALIYDRFPKAPQTISYIFPQKRVLAKLMLRGANLRSAVALAFRRPAGEVRRFLPERSPADRNQRRGERACRATKKRR